MRKNELLYGLSSLCFILLFLFGGCVGTTTKEEVSTTEAAITTTSLIVENITTVAITTTSTIKTTIAVTTRTTTSIERAVTTTIAAKTELLDYENSKHGFSIRYPEDWEKEEPTEYDDEELAITFYSPWENWLDPYKEFLWISVYDYSDRFPPMALSKFTNLLTQSLDITYKNFLSSEAKKTTLAGEPAYTLIYTGNNEGFEIKGMKVWTIKNKKAYVVSYIGLYNDTVDEYSKSLDIAKEMMDSFKID